MQYFGYYGGFRKPFYLAAGALSFGWVIGLEIEKRRLASWRNSVAAKKGRELPNVRR